MVGLAKDERIFVKGIYKHITRTSQSTKLSLDGVQQGLQLCQRKLNFLEPSRAVVGEYYEELGSGSGLDEAAFLALVTRMVTEFGPKTGRKKRKSFAVNDRNSPGEPLGFNRQSLARFTTKAKELSSAAAAGVYSFLGITEGAYNPTLEIYQERERRLSQRKKHATIRPQNQRKSFMYKATVLLRMPGAAIYNADKDPDPDIEEKELLDDIIQQEGEYLQLKHDEGEAESAESVFECNRNAESVPLQTLGTVASPVPSPRKQRRKVGFVVPDDSENLLPLPPRGSTTDIHNALPLPARGKNGEGNVLPLLRRGKKEEDTEGENLLPFPSRGKRDNSDVNELPLPPRERQSETVTSSEVNVLALPPRERPSEPSTEINVLPLPPREGSSQTSTDVNVLPLPPREGSSQTSTDVNVPPLPPRERQSEISTNNSSQLQERKAGYDFIQDEQEALTYYHRRVAQEQRKSVRKRNSEKNAEQKKESGTPSRSKSVRERTKSMKERFKKRVAQKQLENMPVFNTWMIYVITFAQLIVMVVMLFKYSHSNLGLFPKAKYIRLLTLAGSSEDGKEKVRHVNIPNMWFGPTYQQLIHFGAFFTPCVRSDNAIKSRYRQMAAIARPYSMGCCVKHLEDKTNYGLFTYSRKCTNLYGVSATFFERKTCNSLRNQGVSLRDDSSACCTGFLGNCQLLTRSDCSAVNGKFHRNKTCLEVNCLKAVCGYTGLDADPKTPYVPHKPAQWWRSISSLFLHSGAFHCGIVTLAQVQIGRRIEATAGWLRLFLIYMLSGLGGVLSSGVFTPYYLQTGGSPALFGLLAVLVVELIQMWQVVEKPFTEAIRLSFYIGIAFFLGTFPLINNWAHLGGFIFGLMSSIIFLPYITFGKWDARRKRILVFITIPLMFFLYLLLLLLFYLVQKPNFCPSCSKFNCIDFTSNLCHDTAEVDPTRAVLYSPMEELYYRKGGNSPQYS